jgi:hypothetical protein
MLRKVGTALASVAALGVLAAPVQAALITVNYTWVTNNNTEDLSGQLSTIIYDDVMANNMFGLGLTANQVLFTHLNNIGIASNIAEIYVDDGTVVSQSAVHNSLGGFTDFSGGGANPANMPGGNTLLPPFIATGTYSADVNPGPPPNGINTATDILGISYLVSGGLAGIQTALDDGTLRLGFHIRTIGAQGGSDSYVNTPGPGVGPGPGPGGAGNIPEPATLLLFGLGMAVTARFAQRRRRK